MDWKDWIGLKVFIKLEDGTIFTNSTVLTYEEPYFSITDKYNLPVIINVKYIQRIKQEVEL